MSPKILSLLLILGPFSLGQAPLAPPLSEPTLPLSYEVALKSMPPRSKACPAFRPILLGDIRIAFKPEKPPMLPVPSIVQGDNEVVVQVCVDASGTPVAASAVHGPHHFRLSFERYCLQLRFDPYQVNGSAQDVTFYMPFRFSMAP